MRPYDLVRSLSPFGGDEEDRTPDPLLAKQVLSQLSYTPARLCLEPLVFNYSRSLYFVARTQCLRNFVRREEPFYRSFPHFQDSEVSFGIFKIEQ